MGEEVQRQLGARPRRLVLREHTVLWACSHSLSPAAQSASELRAGRWDRSWLQRRVLRALRFLTDSSFQGKGER